MIDAEPFGANGAETDRDDRGRWRLGNTAALVVGTHSAAFWAGVEGVQVERRETILRDLGQSADDAPEALLRAVDGLVQAVLLRDSAFLRIAESGGPTTLRGRRRATFRIWCEASDRAERYLRLVGLARRSGPVPTVESYIASAAQAVAET